MKENINYLEVFKNGIIKENPVFIMLLGTCPSLAVTTMAVNGIGMGLATTFVMVCSNMLISLLKNIIPKEVRLPCFIVIIAGLATFVSILLEAFFNPIYNALGIFLNLIAVNCIVFGRAEVFARKKDVIASALDGLGMGIGFTLALFLIGSIREILGSGTWMGINLNIVIIEPMTVFILPVGGFFTLGIVVAVVGQITKKPAREIGCEMCPSKDSCPNNIEKD